MQFQCLLPKLAVVCVVGNKTNILKLLNLSYWLKLCENICVGAKASWKASVVLANPPVKIFGRHQLTVCAMIKDIISKCKLLFPSFFLLGLIQSLVKWQSSISVVVRLVSFSHSLPAFHIQCLFSNICLQWLSTLNFLAELRKHSL